MKIDRLWIIIRTSVKKNKIKTIILMSFLIISLTLSCLLIGFSLPMQNAIENNIYNNIINRSGAIMFDDEVYNISQVDKDEFISEIEKTPHVTDVYLSGDIQFSTIEIEDEIGDIRLQSLYKENDLIIKKGRNVLPDEKNAVVLPEKIFTQKVGGNGKIKQDTESFVGKTMDFKLNDGSIYKAEVVGIYSSNDLLYQENSAYISYNESLNLKSVDSSEEYYVFEVDNYKNTEDVINSIEAISAQIIAYQIMDIDPTLLQNIQFIQIALLLSLFILIITMISVKVFISSFIKAKIPEIALLKSFGYNNKQLFKILSFEYGVILLLSLLVSIIITICLSIIVINPIIFSNFQYTPLLVAISFNPLIYIAIFVFVLLMICLSCYLELRKTKKFNLFRLLY